MLYLPPVQCHKLLDQHKFKTSQPQKYAKLSYIYFYTFLQIYGSKIKIAIKKEVSQMVNYNLPHMIPIGVLCVQMTKIGPRICLKVPHTQI